jgi:hypothetical protein
MKNRIAGIIASLLTFAVLAGCETTKNSEQEKKDSEKANLTEVLRPTLTEAEKINLAEVILDKMLNGITKDNYGLYSSNFFKGLKEQMPEKTFKDFRSNLTKDMGEYKSRTYIGMLNKKLFDVFIWKVKFSNSEDDCLIRLTLVEDEGAYKVLGFSITKF